MIDLSEYRLETIRKYDEFILYSGTHQTDATASSIFVLTPALEHPAVASLRGLEHEYSLQAELDPDWAVIPIGLVKHDGRTMLVLANFEGDPLDRFIGTPLELRQFLRLAIGLSAALGQLHERGLVHKDIKPANVLVNAATGQVWLTGFGIASRLPRERQSPESPEFIAGTLAYMAPEQTGRMNRSIDSRSDERLPSDKRGARIHDPSTADRHPKSEHSRSPPKRRLRASSHGCARFWRLVVAHRTLPIALAWRIVLVRSRHPGNVGCHLSDGASLVSAPK
jgi:serine/threonine protein kinase